MRSERKTAVYIVFIQFSIILLKIRRKSTDPYECVFLYFLCLSLPFLSSSLTFTSTSHFIYDAMQLYTQQRVSAHFCLTVCVQSFNSRICLLCNCWFSVTFFFVYFFAGFVCLQFVQSLRPIIKHFVSILTLCTHAMCKSVDACLYCFPPHYFQFDMVTRLFGQVDFSLCSDHPWIFI